MDLEERLTYRRNNKERTAEEMEKMNKNAVAIAKKELLEEQRKRISLLESLG